MVPRGRCYDCFRPADACFCAAIPRIANQTEVLILQHRREQFHPFNTARIVHKALLRSQLLAGHTKDLARQLALKPGAGLLYPSSDAPLISELPPEERPVQLVIVDGTWHHVKTLVRDVPALQQVPRYRLAPSSPGRYRIRLEPNETSLSTVEAVVDALRTLEPETAGFDRLIGAFDTMVESQLARIASAGKSHFPPPPQRPWKHIPRALQGSLDSIVVAYGEAAPGERGQKRADGPPISWVARRLGDNSEFACLLAPPKPLSDIFLGHLELSREDYADALSLEDARKRWAEFERPGDLVTVLQPGTARLLSQLCGEQRECLLLKTVNLQSIDPSFVAPWSASEETASRKLGRASRRLENAVALVRQLNVLAHRPALAG